MLNQLHLSEMLPDLELDTEQQTRDRDPLQPFGNLDGPTSSKQPTVTHRTRPKIVADATPDIVSSDPRSNILPISVAENLFGEPSAVPQELQSPETEQSITAAPHMQEMVDDQIFQSYHIDSLPLEQDPVIPCPESESQLQNEAVEAVNQRDILHEDPQDISTLMEVNAIIEGRHIFSLFYG